MDNDLQRKEKSQNRVSLMPPEDPERADEFKVCKTQYLTKMGKISEAVSVLTDPGFIFDEDPIDRLRAKHNRSDTNGLFLHPALSMMSCRMWSVKKHSRART